MAVRVNKAKKFNGKSYVGTDALDTLLAGATFANNTITLITDGKSIEGDTMTTRTIDMSQLVKLSHEGTLLSVSSNTIDVAGLSTFIGTPSALKIVTTDGSSKLEYGNAIVTEIGETPSATNIPTESAVKAYVDGKAITVTGGAGISIDSTTNALIPKISADVDGTTIILSGSGDAAKLAANLTVKKKQSANAGFAATYYLAYGNSEEPIGQEIDIVKDQFLKSVEFIPKATAEDVTAAGTNPGFAANDPVLKFTFDVNTNSSVSDAESESVVYVPVKELVDVYTAGNGIDITSNVVTAVADSADVVYTAASTSQSIITVGASGIKVSGVQTAINYAVGNEHSKMSTAVSAVDGKVNALASATSTSVADLNTKIETVAGNAETAISAVGANVNDLDAKVATAIGAVNTNVEAAIDSAITNVNTAISANISNVNANVNTAVGTVNTKVDEAVSSVNANVGAAITAVSATIDASQSAVNDFKTSVNNVITSAEANRDTQLASAVQMIEDNNVTLTSQAGGSGVYKAEVTNANNIIAVYDPNGIQIYPEIRRSGSAKPYTYTLEAEYGTAPADAKWTVLYTQDLPQYTDAGDVAYTSASTASVAYTPATDGTDASYGAVTKVDAGTVEATDVSYTSSIDADNGTVGKGDTVTPTAPVAAVTVGDLDYTGHNVNA